MIEPRHERNQRHGSGRGNPRPIEEPSAQGNWLRVERCAQLRQQRRRNLGVGFRAEAGIDSGEERSLPGEGRAAGCARIELRFESSNHLAGRGG